MSDCFIWIVDDDADDLDIISQAFRECSMEVRLFTAQEATSVLPALEKLDEKNFPKVILLDINMPQISGKVLLSMIRQDQRFKHIPIVVFTTSNSQKDRADCMELGANSFLTKPVTYQDMLKICASVTTVFCNTVV